MAERRAHRPGNEARAPAVMSGRGKPSLRIDQRTQVLEAIGGDESSGGKLP